MSHFIQTNGIQLHYLQHGRQHNETTPTLLLMPGLTANAQSFDGLIAAGLAEHLNVLAIDLRGRGRSDKPASGYDLAAHAADIIGLLDKLGLAKVIMGGHSFGGLLSLYLAAHHPQRVEKLVVIDAAAAMHPNTRQMIQPSIDRLGKTLPSWSAYLAAVKQLPFFRDWWDPTIESYYQADIEALADGQVIPRSRPEAIIEAVDHVLSEDWQALLPCIHQPLLLLNAVEGFGPPGAPPLLPAEQAMETVNSVADGHYVAVSGNHITMLYGAGASTMSQAITRFIANQA